MVAQVHGPPAAERVHRQKRRHLAAGRPDRRDAARVDRPGADRIVKEAHVEPIARPLGEEIEEAPAGLVVADDVILGPDGTPGRADGLLLPREGPGVVGEVLEAVAGGRRETGEPRGHLEEGALVRSERVRVANDEIGASGDGPAHPLDRRPLWRLVRRTRGLARTKYAIAPAKGRRRIAKIQASVPATPRRLETARPMLVPTRARFADHTNQETPSVTVTCAGRRCAPFPAIRP